MLQTFLSASAFENSVSAWQDKSTKHLKKLFKVWCTCDNKTLGVALWGQMTRKSCGWKWLNGYKSRLIVCRQVEIPGKWAETGRKKNAAEDVRQHLILLSLRGSSPAAEELQENWGWHWHAILTMTCCFTQTLLMLTVLHTHTHAGIRWHMRRGSFSQTQPPWHVLEKANHTLPLSHPNAISLKSCLFIFLKNSAGLPAVSDSHTYRNTPPTNLQSHESSNSAGHAQGLLGSIILTSPHLAILHPQVHTNTHIHHFPALTQIYQVRGCQS